MANTETKSNNKANSEDLKANPKSILAQVSELLSEAGSCAAVNNVKSALFRFPISKTPWRTSIIAWRCWKRLWPTKR